MKRIVAFGDSNTWGYDPNSKFTGKTRFGSKVRWTGRLQQILGENYQVLEEGLCGRTTVWEDPIEAYRCGKDMIIPILMTHDPVDLLIIMLGTNDLKVRFGVPASDIAQGAGVIIDMAKSTASAFRVGRPEILLVAPAPLTVVEGDAFADCFKGANQKSRELGSLYKKLAHEKGVHFLDAGQWIEADPTDGVHLSPEAHGILAEKISAHILTI